MSVTVCTTHRPRAVHLAIRIVTVGLAGLIIACSPAAPAAPTLGPAQTPVPTAAAQAGAGVQAGASSVAIARQGTATAVAPTAAAMATLVAPIVPAAGTQIAAAVGTSVANSPVQLAAVKVDPTDTTATIRNSGTASINLNGWTLVIGPRFWTVLLGVTADAGQTRTLHLSSGTDSPGDVYLGYGSSAASTSLSSGGRVALISPSGMVMSVYSVS